MTTATTTTATTLSRAAITSRLNNKYKMLDSANEPAAEVTEAQAQTSAADYATRNITMQAVAALHVWCEDDNYDDNEGSSDRLFGLAVGIADANKDGELDNDEQGVVEQAMNAQWEYLSSKGVDETDLDLLFNSEDPEEANGAGDRVKEFLAGVLPDGEEEAMNDVDSFVFGREASEPMLDSAYKKKFAIRGGKKVIKRVRVAGHVRLTAKQKIGIMKMQRKSHSAAANMHRQKSMKLSRRMGL
jgi:hypothetical protein